MFDCGYSYYLYESLRVGGFYSLIGLTILSTLVLLFIEYDSSLVKAENIMFSKRLRNSIGLAFLVFCAFVWVFWMVFSGLFLMQSFEASNSRINKVQGMLVEVNKANSLFTPEHRDRLNKFMACSTEDGKISEVEVVMFETQYKDYLKEYNRKKNLVETTALIKSEQPK